MKKKLLSVLLIDDDEEDNYFHQIIIGEMNITAYIKVTLSGFEALDFLKNEKNLKPDLLLLDINMPKMNGWEFLEQHDKLKKEQKAKLIVVMQSKIKGCEDDEQAALFSRNIDFICKPLTEKSLLEILEGHFS
jgi:CheY-like chemotaxis protein